MKKTQFKGVVMLLLTAFIWGSSFVAQSVGMESVDSFTFNGLRTLMGAAVLIPFIIVRDKINSKKPHAPSAEKRRKADKKVLVYGAILGVILCAASNFQQHAFNYSSAGKIAFITAFYMMFVPIFGLLIGKKVPAITWLCVIMGTVGLYFLCVGEEGFAGINFGDILTLICSVIYAVHILAIEKFAADADPVKLSCVQFAVSGSISVILMFIFETPDPVAIRACIVPMLYSGIMSCGLAYTFQIVGQKYTESTVASLLMCMESVFGVLCSALLLNERLSGREFLGCGIMFLAIILSQVSEKITAAIRKKAKQLWK